MEAEFKEFQLRLKFETRLKHCWFYLKLHLVLRDLSQHSIGTGFFAVQLASVLLLFVNVEIDCFPKAEDKTK